MYNRKLYSFYLINKSKAKITKVLISFKNFIKRQYRLLIYIFKHNNNTLVIAIYKYIVYKIQTNIKEIKKELSLINIYKSNRGAEYIR